MARGLNLIILFSTFTLGNVWTREVITFRGNSTQARLLELYTSQGCSSCPPAERWMGDLKNHPELWKTVFPLAFHVTYWDYLGWKDPFSEKVFTERQETLAGFLEMSTIYTPGFFLNGREYRSWRQGPLAASPHPTSGTLTLRLSDKNGTATYQAGSGEKPTALHVALLTFGEVTDIPRGENSGRTLKQEFVVRSLNKISGEKSSWEFSLAPLSRWKFKQAAVVAWVNGPGGETPLQIAGGWLP